MTTRQTPFVFRVMGTAGFAGALFLAALSVPALASSGVDTICDHADAPLSAANRTDKPKAELTSRTDATLDEVLVDETADAGDAAAKASDKSSPTSDSGVEAATMRNIEFPHVSTSPSGASDATLPSFRRQMFRTDI